jgi:hypothetical protein
VLIHKKRIAQVFVTDENQPFLGFAKMKYYLPTLQEIYEINSFHKNKFIIGFDIKNDRLWNCRSNSESYKVMANLYHAKYIKSEANSIAIGNVYLNKYKINSKDGHVLNVIFYRDNSNKIKYTFLDALGNFEKLNKKQFNSIELIIF